MKTFVGLTVLSLLLPGLAACESQQPATHVGQALDRAGTATGQAVGTAAATTGRAVNRAGNYIDQKVNPSNNE